MNREKLVVVGNGMAGARVVEEILARAPGRFDIVMFGAEPYGNYNRILLSNVLNRSQQATEIFMNPLAWYAENRITLHAGVKAVKIDREARVVIGRSVKRDASPYAAGETGTSPDAPILEAYDHVIIATGSRPFVPPMEGFGQPGTFLFRTIDDCSRIADQYNASTKSDPRHRGEARQSHSGATTIETSAQRNQAPLVQSRRPTRPPQRHACPQRPQRQTGNQPLAALRRLLGLVRRLATRRG
ncbi:MAG: FAD-dependent oxidoreductase, partial [Vicinamibacterales bacterium]